MTGGSRLRRLALWLLTGFYAVLWTGGVIAYVFRGGPAAADWWTAPLFLALAAILVTVSSAAPARPWLAVALAVGFLSELIGVRTGWPFGAYHYTSALRPTVLGVPVVISMAWMVLVAFVQQAVVRAGLRGWRAVSAGSVAMVAVDLVVDPVAAGPLQYWAWHVPGEAYYGIPLRNFAGWLAVSAIIFALLAAGDTRHARPGPRLVGLSIVAFFGVIAAAFGLTVPALVAVALCAFDIVLKDRPSGR